jgi:uncharacterized membrane protein YdjX (TVP38/TMEM64 family)
MTGRTVPAAAGLGGRHRTTRAHILLRIGLLLAVLGLLAAAGQLLGPWSPDRLGGLLDALGPFAVAGFVGLFVVLNTGGVPAPLLGAAGGLALGLVPGALATLAGMTVAACGQLLLGRRLTGSALAAVRLPGSRRLQKVLQGRGWLAVVALRMVPGPFSEVNLAAGLTPLRLRSMAVGTLIGGAPKALAWAALGLGATRLPALPPFLIAAVIVTSVVLTVAWLRWRGPRSPKSRPTAAKHSDIRTSTEELGARDARPQDLVRDTNEPREPQESAYPD